MQIYRYDSYKQVLRVKIEENEGAKGYRSRLAEAAGCSRSFLSQVLNTHVHLTPDHGAGLCEFWSFDKDESSFFIDLMGFERAATQTLRKIYRERIRKRRAESTRVANRPAKSEGISNSIKEALYYSAWHTAAIHTMTAIPGLQTPRAMAQRLEIPVSLVERTLIDLASIGLVEKQGKAWQIIGGSVHLAKGSPLSNINQENWRLRAMRHLGAFPNDGLHFSALFVLSKQDRDAILESLKEAIYKVVDRVEASPEEELVCLCMDYFPV